MSTLLASGEFVIEALSPAAEALELGIKCLQAIKMTPKADLFDLQPHFPQVL